MMNITDYIKAKETCCFFCSRRNGGVKRFRFVVHKTYSIYACASCINQKGSAAVVMSELEALPLPQQALNFFKGKPVPAAQVTLTAVAGEVKKEAET